MQPGRTAHRCLAAPCRARTRCPPRRPRQRPHTLPTAWMASLPDELRARIFALLPPGDEILTVPRICKALAAATAPRVARLRQGLVLKMMTARHRNVEAYIGLSLNPVGMLPSFDTELFSIPLWALQEAWPRLQPYRRLFVVSRAAFHGHLAVLQWALPQLANTGDRAYACMAAAAGGQLEALQWVHALGCSLPWQTCDVAAKGGHLACCSGCVPRSRPAPGVRTHALKQRAAANWLCCSGCVPRTRPAPGIRGPALKQPRVANARCCSGCELRTRPVPGMRVSPTQRSGLAA